MFAPDFVHTVPPRLAGVTAERSRDVAAGQEGVARDRVTGEISAPRGLGYAKAFRRERAIEPRLDKAAVPSPFTIGLSFPAGELTDATLEGFTRVVTDEVESIVAGGQARSNSTRPPKPSRVPTEAERRAS